MPRGRPSKYTPELLEKAREYADKWDDLGDVVPMLCGMAIHCDIAESTLQEWRGHEDKAEFSDLCARVFGKQKRSLINGGLGRTFDASLSKLLLNKHGISDKQDINHTSEDGSMSPTDEGRKKARGSILESLDE